MEKTIAIMQPYFLPYIGYFQLINLADTFVIYDDVNFIKGGWINRNRMLVQNQPAFFNIEMSGASSNKKILEIALNPSKVWKNKLKKKIMLSYQKAPCFTKVFPIIERIIDFETTSLSQFVANSIKEISIYLEIDTKIVESSSAYENDNLSAYHRVIDICRKEGGHRYVNPIGGEQLYSKQIFADNELELLFHKSNTITYPQFGTVFFEYLSIMDVLMFNEKSEVQVMLNKFSLE